MPLRFRILYYFNSLLYEYLKYSGACPITLMDTFPFYHDIILHIHCTNTYMVHMHTIDYYLDAREKLNNYVALNIEDIENFHKFMCNK